MNVMNAIAIRPTVMNVIPSPRRAAGTLEYAIFSLIAARVHEIPFLHEERATEDGAVHGDERKEDSKLRIQGRCEFLHYHFHNLCYCGNHCDEHYETEKTEVDIRKSEPCKRPGFQYILVQKVVDRERNQEHADNSYTQTSRSLNTFRYRQI